MSRKSNELVLLKKNVTPIDFEDTKCCSFNIFINLFLTYTNLGSLVPFKE